MNNQTPSKKRIIFLLSILFIGLFILFPVRWIYSSGLIKPNKTIAKILHPFPLGLKIVDVYPSDDLLLKDGESMIKGNTGSATSVPDLIFGDRYIGLNDVNKNYLPIRKEVAFFNNGFFITLRNQGCDTENRFTDVLEVWVTKCHIAVNTEKGTASVRKLKPFSKLFATSSYFKGQISDFSDPLIYVRVPNVKIAYSDVKFDSSNTFLATEKMSSYSGDTPWVIDIISAYGIGGFSYVSQEIWDKKSKNTNIGPLHITSDIKGLNCKEPMINQQGVKSQGCDSISVQLSFSQSDNQTPIKLASFSE